MNIKYLLLLVFFLSGCSIVSSHKLTSDLSGIVTLNGKPLSGAKIRFKVNSHWYGEWEENEILTNSKGEFSLPQWKKVSFFVLVHQPVIEQEIIIEYGGKVYEGWRYTRMSYSDKTDIVNNSFLRCELKSKLTQQEIKGAMNAKGI